VKENGEAPAATPAQRWVAILAGAVFPGLGYLVLRRWRRGLLLGGLVLGSFGLGLAHDGTLALRNPEQPFLSTLQLVGNVGAGPLDLAARIAVYGGPRYRLPHETHSVAQTFRSRMRLPTSTYGTAYLWIAGLMNYLLLFDVWDVGRGLRPSAGRS